MSSWVWVYYSTRNSRKEFHRVQKRQWLPLVTEDSFQTAMFGFKSEEFLRRNVSLANVSERQKIRLASISTRDSYIAISAVIFSRRWRSNSFYPTAEIRLVSFRRSSDRECKSFIDLTQCLGDIPRKSIIIQHWNSQFSMSRRPFNLEKLDQKPSSCLYQRVDLLPCLCHSLLHCHNYKLIVIDLHNCDELSCDELSCDELSARRIVRDELSATNCPATNCPPTVQIVLSAISNEANALHTGQLIFIVLDSSIHDRICDDLLGWCNTISVLLS